MGGGEGREGRSDGKGRRQVLREVAELSDRREGQGRDGFIAQKGALQAC